MQPLEIFVYGSGDFVVEIFKGLVLMTSVDMIMQLLSIVLLVGLITAIVQPITGWLSAGHLPMNTGGEGFIAMFRQVLLAVLVTRLMLIPVCSVLITDRVDPGQGGPVDNVPLVTASIAFGASRIGDTIAKHMEQAFNQPSTLNFRTGGVGLGIKYIDSIFSIRPPSASTPTGGAVTNAALISQSLRDYFAQCVFPNYGVLDGGGGSKTAALYRLSNQNDILGALATDQAVYADPNIYITSPNSTGTASCATALGDINTAWASVKSDWLKEVEAKVAGDSSIDPALIGTGSLGQEVIHHYFPLASDPYKVLQNIAVGNLMRDAALLYGAKYGDTTETAANLATKSTMSGWTTTARVFGSIVHVMRNVFEGLIYGLSCLLPIAVAIGGLAPLGTYLKVLLWLQLWVPFYVLLNLFGDMEMQRSMAQLAAGSADGGPTVKQWLEVGEKAQLSLAYLGSLSFVVPSFAWGLLKGGEYAMSTAINAMTSGSGAASTASSIGGSVGIGNTHAFSKSIGNDRVGVSTYATSAMAFAGSMGDFRAKTDVKGLTGMGFSDQSYARSVMGGLESTSKLNAYPNLREATQDMNAGARFGAGELRTVRHGAEMSGNTDPFNLGFAAKFPSVVAGFRAAKILHGKDSPNDGVTAVRGAQDMGDAAAGKLADNVTWLRAMQRFSETNGVPLLETLQLNHSRFNQSGDLIATDMNGNKTLHIKNVGTGTNTYVGFQNTDGGKRVNFGTDVFDGERYDSGKTINTATKITEDLQRDVGNASFYAAQLADKNLFAQGVDENRFWSVDTMYRQQHTLAMAKGISEMYRREAIGSVSTDGSIGAKGHAGPSGEIAGAQVEAGGRIASQTSNIRSSNDIYAKVTDIVNRNFSNPNLKTPEQKSERMMQDLKAMHDADRASRDSSLPGRHLKNVEDQYNR